MFSVGFAPPSSLQDLMAGLLRLCCPFSSVDLFPWMFLASLLDSASENFYFFFPSFKCVVTFTCSFDL